MASTNKTTHYELSQFLGTDKPAWLGDYNSDMQKIDTGINTAQTTATGADGKADANTTSIGSLTNLTTDAKTNLVSAINEVDGHADTAQETANSATLLANTNKNDIANLKSILNLSVINKYNSGNVTLSNCNQFNGEITVARDATGEIFKVYGTYAIVPTVNVGNTYTITINNTGIETDTPYIISPAGFTTGNDIVDNITITISNNTIVIEGGSRGNGVWSNGRLFPSIYFNTDFGDTPVNPSN